MAVATRLGELDAIPRLGWVREPTPVTSLPRLAEESGAEWIGVKRDDLLEPLSGGTKPRKLDYLLASPPFADAPVWAAAGAIGSGNLVALTAAARLLERRVEAHLFWTPISEGTLDNLAFIASGPTTLSFYSSSTTMALRRPALIMGERFRGAPIVTPGASAPRGMLGIVRAGLELAAQIEAGELPEPDRIYVAFGSGGTAIGLAVGLALAGVRSTVVGVGVVARALSGSSRAHSLERAVVRELNQCGIQSKSLDLKLALNHAHRGPGYAVVTEESLSACEKLSAEGIRLEPVYTGKAMAALFDDVRSGAAKKALFWLTARRDPIPHDDAWRERLPTALARRLEEAESQDGPKKGPRITRRRVLVGASAAAAALLFGIRISGYTPLAGFSGAVLSLREAHVVRAAAEAVLPRGLDEAALTDIAMRVDRYLIGMPETTLRDVHRMLALIEHGTTPLGRRLHRFTLLTPAARLEYFDALEASGGLRAQAYRGIRDLCMVGFYQRSVTWPAIGYEGPRVALDYDPRGPERMAWPRYDAMRAADGDVPKGIVR